MSQDIWQFEDGADVSLICAQLPVDERPPYADPHHENYVELTSFADLDALFGLYGHLRAVNPTANVRIRAAQDIEPNDVTGHIVVIGGVAWNSATAWLSDLMKLPVQQLALEDDAFSVEFDGESLEFRADVVRGGRGIVGNDYGLFARSVNPYDSSKTITFCNGVLAAGVNGVVKCFTDPAHRVANQAVLSSLGHEGSIGLLMAVKILNGSVVTPRLDQESTIQLSWAGSRLTLAQREAKEFR